MPELIPAIKRRLELNKPPGQYLVTGSQQWGIMKLLSESLAGRVVFMDLDGFSLIELAKKKNTKPKLEISPLPPRFTVVSLASAASGADHPDRLSPEPCRFPDLHLRRQLRGGVAAAGRGKVRRPGGQLQPAHFCPRLNHNHQFSFNFHRPGLFCPVALCRVSVDDG